MRKMRKKKRKGRGRIYRFLGGRREYENKRRKERFRKTRKMRKRRRRRR